MKKGPGEERLAMAMLAFSDPNLTPEMASIIIDAILTGSATYKDGFLELKVPELTMTETKH